MKVIEFLGEYFGPLLILLGLSGIIRTVTDSFIAMIVGTAILLGIFTYVVERKYESIPQNRHTVQIALGLITALLIRMFITR